MKNNAFILGTLLLISAAAFAHDTAHHLYEDHHQQESTTTNVSSFEHHDKPILSNGIDIILEVAIVTFAMYIVISYLFYSSSTCGAELVHDYHHDARRKTFSVAPDYSTQAGTYNEPVYQNRSLEYTGPILKALSNAHDKYARQISAPAKKE